MSNVVYRRDPTRTWRMWHINEIFTGKTGVTTEHLYVPNVDDLVFNGISTFYKVTAVDQVTAIPTLEAINPSAGFEIEVTDPDNLMHGLRSYEPHGVNRIFIDTSTKPSTISVDSRYRVYGSEATQIKLFMGYNTGPNGVVISQKLNSSGVVVSETVDLEPLYGTDNTIKRPLRFHSTRNLADGERVTMVVYNASGRVCGEHPFIVRNANMICGPTASSIYIEDIELVSDLISKTDPLLIENPLHVPLATSMMFCRVHYSNGKKADHSIDGNKVKIHGLGAFNTSILGPINNVVLSYYPSPTEPAINLQGVLKPSISKVYKLANKSVSGDIALKLYVSPVWTGSGYKLYVRLTNKEYNVNIDVTENVRITNVNGLPFRPNEFGVQQHISLTLAIDSINPDMHPGFIHAQQLKISLNPPGPTNVNSWVIDYGGDGYTYFGADKYCQASVVSKRKYRIDANQTNLTDWLSWMYWAIDPSFDNTLSDRAPTPTHFRLEHGGANGSRVIGTYPIEAWDTEFELGENRDWEQEYPMNITWLVMEGSTEKVLGLSAMAIKYIYNPDGD